VSRFEVRETSLSDDLVRRYPSLPREHYTVWDTDLSKPVPFGGYSDRARAQDRADREEAKVNGS
jgi:hypothetical protein